MTNAELKKLVKKLLNTDDYDEIIYTLQDVLSDLERQERI